MAYADATVLANSGRDFDGEVYYLNSDETKMLGGTAYQFTIGVRLFSKDYNNELSAGSHEVVISNSDSSVVAGCPADVKAHQSNTRVHLELPAVNTNSKIYKIFTDQ